MKPTLFVLAAGMGSRYGGLKQLDTLGPQGQSIMDYSIYDAIQAGFGKIVWVIRRDFEEQFRKQILSKYEGHVPCELCFQAIDALPEGFSVPEGREKPWGTNHAVMMGADVVKEPFAVLNCDDFYDRDAFQVMAKFLSELPEGSTGKYAMVGFRVDNTLSESGTVSRGVCENDEKTHYLTSVVERTKIERHDGVVQYLDDNGEWVSIPDTTPVSMNFWGFTPWYFQAAEAELEAFLRAENGDPMKKEYALPTMVDRLMHEKGLQVEVLSTKAVWFGVTYREDKEYVAGELKKLHQCGAYPEKL